ncbi:MAG: aldolase/citrate lyase family protein [Candidatus Limnocylindrales bacterium]
MSTTDATPSPIPASGFRARVLAREQLFGTFLFMGGMGPAEIAARSGLDWVLVDQEHGSGTDADLLPQLAAIQAAASLPGTAPDQGRAAALVRVEQATRLRIGRALDLGAEGIMVPQVNDAATAREVVSWLRFPPAGTRGVALGTRGLAYGTGGHPAVDRHNERVTCIVQVESGVAVAAADEMAAIDGVDCLFVGPTDLTHALGVRGDLGHASYRDAITAVADAARRHGKAAGVMLWTPADAPGYAELGYTLFSLSNDGSVLDKALRGLLQAGREAISSR